MARNIAPAVGPRKAYAGSRRVGTRRYGVGLASLPYPGNIVARTRHSMHGDFRKGHPMRRVKLDRIDLQILNDLQENGRITNVELASRAGISAPPCLRRVRALEEAGFIRNYHAELKAEALGFDVLFYALVGLDAQSELVRRVARFTPKMVRMAPEGERPED